MKRLIILCSLALLFLSGCGTSADGIPEGLSWRAQTLQSQEDGTILACAEDWSSEQAVPLLDVTAQVEDGAVTLTDHTTQEIYSGSLTPMEDASPGIYTLAFPDVPEGYGVYGVTEYADGSRDATLYLTVEKRTLCLTAPLS